MSRIRSVHPGLFTDEGFVGLSDTAQIFFVGLWTEADDYGAFEWKPVTLKIKLRGASTLPVEPLLEELRAADRIRQYEYDGRQYGVIRNFTRFQRPKSPKSTHLIPPELRTYTGSTEPITEIPRVEEPPFPPKGEKPPQMEDGGCKGRRERTESLSPTPETPPRAPVGAEIFDLEFQRFWQVYPRRDDRGHALKAYRTARKKADEEAIVGGARWYADSRRGQDQKFTALAATWLNGERWLDDRTSGTKVSDGIIPMHPGAGG